MQITSFVKRILMGLCLAAAAQPAKAAMQIVPLTDQDGYRILYLHGQLSDSDVRRVSKELSKPNAPTEVWLNSGGGSASAGVALGQVFFERGVWTRVPSKDKLTAAILGHYPLRQGQELLERYAQAAPSCASACVMLLAGGRARFVDKPLQVGIHALSLSNTDGSWSHDKGQNIAIATHRWTLFLQKTGVDPALAERASRISPDCMYWLSAGEINGYNLTNVDGEKLFGGPSSGYFEPDTGTCELSN